ncbi:unnamed protein product, partial [Mesorhabditis spiculigera]
MCDRGGRACVSVFHWSFSALLALGQAAQIAYVYWKEWPVLINHFTTNWPILTHPPFLLANFHILALMVSLIAHHKKCCPGHTFLIITSMAICAYYPVILKRTEPSAEMLKTPTEKEYVWYGLGCIWALTVLHTCFLLIVLFVSCAWKGNLRKGKISILKNDAFYGKMPEPTPVYMKTAYVHHIFVDPSSLE